MKLINFNDPKVMAYSGLIAMLPKTAIALIFSLITALLISKPQAILALMVLWYPVVGSLIDLQLYKLKDKLWNKLPTNIPELWDITPEQLLTYAKYLPKIRLMRWAGCWVLLPFMTIDKGWLLLTLSTIAVGFFLAVLFDRIWLKFFNIKKPKFFNLIDRSKEINICNIDEIHNRITKYNDATFPGSPAWYSAREHDPCTIGSTTWYSRQHFN